MIKNLIVSLALTLIIELTVSLLLGIRSKTDFLIAACANVCTNPALVYIFSLIVINSQSVIINYSALALLEILAVLIEAYIFKKLLSFDNIPPLLLSLINNAASFGCGLIIFGLLK